MSKKRLILTYKQSCNLSCEFCYVSFENKKLEDRSIEIVERAIELGFDIITFGGGDPFTKKNFRAACKLASSKKVTTQVDTNGIKIKENDLSFLLYDIDILGFSLDGIGSIHDEMRGSFGLFDKLKKLFEKLEKEKKRIKVNTVVTQRNYRDLKNIFEFLKKFKNIKVWSIYQFFPLDAALRFREKFEISDTLFENVTSQIQNSQAVFPIEKFKFSDRVNGYIFCDELGNLYTNDIDGSYKEIGSIFKTEIDKTLENFRSINPKVAYRYI